MSKQAKATNSFFLTASFNNGKMSRDSARQRRRWRDEVRAIQMGIHRKAKKERAFMGEKE